MVKSRNTGEYAVGMNTQAVSGLGLARLSLSFD